MIDLKTLEDKKKELSEQLEKLKANLNAYTGALQLLDHLIMLAKAEVVKLEDLAKAEVVSIKDKIESKI